MSRKETLQLSNNLKWLCKKTKSTERAISRTTGISQSTINGFSNGAHPKSLDHIKTIADHFKISIDELLYHDLRTPGSDQASRDYSGTYEVTLEITSIRKKLK